MGTRADFYIGRGEDAEWLGSIAWDGYPGGISGDLLRSTSEPVFRANLARFFAEREDVTLPDRGWPWPWEDSGTTDYAYALDGGGVWASNFGREWFRVDPGAESYGEPMDDDTGETALFPNMRDRQNVRMDRGSGVIVLGFLGQKEES